MLMVTCQQRCVNMGSLLFVGAGSPPVLADSQVLTPVVGRQPLPLLPAAGGVPAAAAHPGGRHGSGACRRPACTSWEAHGCGGPSRTSHAQPAGASKGFSGHVLVIDIEAKKS